MIEFFGPQGVIAQNLPDYEFRPSQIRMAEAVAGALEQQNHAVIEAGTGTGKTIAYLLPALLHGRRILVSTGTKTLQDQIFYKDIPLLEMIVGRPIRAAYLKGRNNYLCVLKLEALHAEGLFSPKEFRTFQKILEWSKKTQTGDRSELDAADDDPELWGRLDARRDRCLGSKCEDFERCFLTLVRQRAQEADIVVVNHHLFFADLALRGTGKSDGVAILPDYSAVIFDEAHELEDVATDYFGFHVSNYRVLELVQDARRLAAQSEAEVDGIDQVQRASDRFFNQFALLGEGRHPLPRLEGIEGLIAAVRDARRSLKRQQDFSGNWEALRRRSTELIDELEVFRAGDLENYVSWIERRGRGVFLEACPIDVSGMLREMLFERVPTCVLTSATLTIGNSFSYFRERIGLQEGAEIALSSEFNLQTQAMLYVPKRMPDYRHPSYPTRAAEEITRILEASRGRAFVLFTSYQQMMAAFERVSAAVPFPCLVQNRDGGRSRLLDEFKATPNAVLFATASFWQGVDVKGEALSAVIIDKLPFQVPSDPLVHARMSKIEKEGGSPFSEYQIPQAVLKLRQGLGRLIRSKSDRGILAILDNRLTTKAYGRIFLSSLREYRMTDRFEDLVQFMVNSES